MTTTRATYRRTLPFLAAALVGVAVASCTGGSSGPDGTAAGSSGSSGSSGLSATSGAPGTTTARPLTVAWRSSGVRPVSPVAVSGSTALVYGVQARQLRLYALAAATGKLIWQRPVSTSDLTPGVNLRVSVVGGRVTYFEAYRRGDGHATALVVADPATGRVVSRSPRRFFASEPTACGTGTICLTAYNGNVPREYRLRVADGRLSASPGRAAGYRELATELYDPLRRDPEYLTRRAAGREVWRVTLRGLYGSRISTDNGWQFEKYGTTAYAGALFTDYEYSGRTSTLDLSGDIVSAGFRVSDGGRIWRTRGVSVDCNYTLGLVYGTPPPVRCSYRGSITYRFPEKGGDPTTSVRGLAVTLQGFDPATGRTTWQLPFGSSEALVNGSGQRVVRSGSEAVVRRGNVSVVVDLRSGRTSAVTAADTFWCQKTATFVAAPRTARDDDRPENRTSTLVTSCNANGVTVDRTPTSVAAPLSATAGGLRLVSTPTAVVAYR